MSLTAAVFLFLASCGQPFVGLGLYSVDIKYVRDDWPGGEAGKETTAKWSVTESEGGYTLAVRGTPFKYKGKERGDFLLFRKTTKDAAPSCFKHTVELKMYPQKDEKKVRGIGETHTIMDCEGHELVVQITFQGYLTEEF